MPEDHRTRATATSTRGRSCPSRALEQANAQIEALGGDAGQGRQAQAGHGQHATAGHHQGGRAKLQLHLGRQLPGNHQGAHRGGPGRQDRPPGGPEGERDPRPPGPGRHRLPHLPGFGGPHPPAGPGRPGGRRRKTSWPGTSRCWTGGKEEPAKEGDGQQPAAPAAAAEPVPTSLDALLQDGGDDDEERKKIDVEHEDGTMSDEVNAMDRNPTRIGLLKRVGFAAWKLDSCPLPLTAAGNLAKV